MDFVCYIDKLMVTFDFLKRLFRDNIFYLIKTICGPERCWKADSYQVHSDSTSNQEAQVNINGVVLVLYNPSQTTNDCTHHEGEDQQGLEQLGRVCQCAVEIHLSTHNIDHSSCALFCISHCSVGFIKSQWKPRLKAKYKTQPCSLFRGLHSESSFISLSASSVLSPSPLWVHSSCLFWLFDKHKYIKVCTLTSKFYIPFA